VVVRARVAINGGFPMGVGKLVLYRFNGDEEYEIQRATILAYQDDDAVYCLKQKPRECASRVYRIP
jgi:hypothetical protein